MLGGDLLPSPRLRPAIERLDRRDSVCDPVMSVIPRGIVPADEARLRELTESLVHHTGRQAFASSQESPGPERAITSSHMMRSAHRRPRRSIAAISARPVVDPRTERPGSGVARVTDIEPSPRVFWFPKHQIVDTVSVSETLQGSTMTTTTRINPLDPPYEPEVETQLDDMMPPGVPPILLFRTFAKNLPMAHAMRGWGGYELGRELSLSLRDREIVIDRTCARCQCEYEWAVHVAFFGRKPALTEQQITSLVWGDPADPCWTSERERLLITGSRPAPRQRRRRRRSVVRIQPRLRGTRDPRSADALRLVPRDQLCCERGEGAPENGAPTFADVAGG